MECDTSGLTRFVARQPILDSAQNVIGYELLFRSGVQNYFPDIDKTVASRSVIDKSLLLGLDVLCGGHRAFINCTREVLVDELLTALPPETTVVEILEGVDVDDEVVAACRRLKEAGYTIALDDFVPGGPQGVLLELADVVKLDFRELPVAALRRAAHDYLARGLVLLAEKLETQAEFEQALKLGFTHFQGYFFAKPAMIPLPELPITTLNRLRILQYIASPELDYAKIENGIKQDAALCYRLLRYLNSVHFSLAAEVNSIGQALILMGEQEIRRWVALLVAFVVVQDRPAILFQHALQRAAFCERLAAGLRWGGQDCFLLGLFSLMDAILNLPMPALLQRVTLPETIRQALLGGHGELGRLLQFVKAYESADWSACDKLATLLGTDEERVAQAYVDSVAWTGKTARLSSGHNAEPAAAVKTDSGSGHPTVVQKSWAPATPLHTH